MGTTLRELITELGGGPEPGVHILAVLPGVSNTFIPDAKLNTPLTYEAMRAAGSGLGAGGFIVFDERDDLVAVAQGVARFLAVESCGQCTPCKQDGLAIADLLFKFCESNATEADADELASRIDTVADEARCNLAAQQQLVAGSLLALFPGYLARHLETSPERAPAVTPVLIAPLRVVRGEESEIETSYARQAAGLDPRPDRLRRLPCRAPRRLPRGRRQLRVGDGVAATRRSGRSRRAMTGQPLSTCRHWVLAAPGEGGHNPRMASRPTVRPGRSATCLHASRTPGMKLARS